MLFLEVFFFRKKQKWKTVEDQLVFKQFVHDEKKMGEDLLILG